MRWTRVLTAAIVVVLGVATLTPAGAQTKPKAADVGITDKVIRRTATAHGIVSFVYNTALVALMVNIAASAISG